MRIEILRAALSVSDVEMSAFDITGSTTLFKLSKQA
jgi:hypothetical protein